MSIRVVISGASLTLNGVKLILGEAEENIPGGSPPGGSPPAQDFVFQAGNAFGSVGYSSVSGNEYGSLISISDSLNDILSGSAYHYLNTNGGGNMAYGVSSSGIQTALTNKYSSFTIAETGETHPVPGTPGSGAEWVYFGVTDFIDGNTYSLTYTLREGFPVQIIAGSGYLGDGTGYAPSVGTLEYGGWANIADGFVVATLPTASTFRIQLDSAELPDISSLFAVRVVELGENYLVSSATTLTSSLWEWTLQTPFAADSTYTIVILATDPDD